MSRVALPRLVLTGLRGGSGKTVVTLGLIGGWRSHGLNVAPFKKGPDYIDPSWLRLAADRPCYNLDTYLMSDEQVRASFCTHYGAADVALVEGNRGLFDGIDAAGSYSSAELAKRLDAPVVLVADCTKSTRTVAAMVLGCLTIDPELHLAGVILNQVASTRQESVIRQAVEQHCGVPVFGAVPRMTNLVLTERHLGLLPPAEHPDGAGLLDEVTRRVCGNLDVEALEGVARSAAPLDPPTEPLYTPTAVAGSGLRIGVVRDSAFHFYYPENLEALRSCGAELIEVSAVHDRALPDVDALYIGGGFPETHASLLAGNEGFRRSVRERIEQGLPVYGECGGLIYLCESVRVSGRDWPMLGVFPVRFRVERKPQGHGYAVVRVDRPNAWFEPGTELRGHEFRYCRVHEDGGASKASALAVERGYGFDGGRDGLVYKNVWACFCHVHALGTPQWAAGMIRQARAYRDAKVEVRQTPTGPSVS